jgi:hypothetical protein
MAKEFSYEDALSAPKEDKEKKENNEFKVLDTANLTRNGEIFFVIKIFINKVNYVNNTRTIKVSNRKC